MQECGEAMGQFVVTGGEATKLLEPIEESLDEVSRLVAMPVDVALREPMASGRNDGLSARGFDGRDQRIAVVSLVGHNRSGWDGRHEGRALRDIGDLAVRINRTGLPSASTVAWIFVVSPPRDRPIA